MKNKKTLYSLILFVILLFSCSILTSAAWKTENGSRYYYGADGQKYVGGPKTIGGKKYLFKSTGELITDQVTLYKKKLYLSKTDGTLLTTWGKVKGKTYYGTSAGKLKTGLQTYNGSTYYFDTTTGAMLKKSWATVNGVTYYLQSNGKAAKNKWLTIDGGKYRFNKKGQVLHGLQRIGKNYYLLGKKTGKMQLGSVKYGKYYYYLNKKTGIAITNGWKTIKGNKYYYDSMGRRQTGWLILNGKKYYLDPAKNGAMVKGTKKIDGKTYKFGTKGYVSVSSGNIVVKVNKKKCVVTVYDNGVPVKAMRCSPGRSGCDTPSGVFTVKDHLAWWVLDGPSYGQYCSHFLPSYLFHSVPMHTTVRDPYQVRATDFNRLGTPASAGCIRLSVADSKWIYYNVPVGSTVVISDTEATPLGKPSAVKMPANTYGADPTDDFKNPAGYDVKIKA